MKIKGIRVCTGVLVVFLSLVLVPAKGQNCDGIFDSEDLKNELFNEVVRKNVFRVKPGKKILVSAYLYGGKVYMLDFVNKDKRKIQVRLLSKDKSKVLFENNDDDGINNLQVSYNITEKVIIELLLETKDPGNEAEQCLGLLIRTFND